MIAKLIFQAGRADNVTRAMSKGGGAACESPRGGCLSISWGGGGEGLHPPSVNPVSVRLGACR